MRGAPCCSAAVMVLVLVVMRLPASRRPPVKAMKRGAGWDGSRPEAAARVAAVVWADPAVAAAARALGAPLLLAGAALLRLLAPAGGAVVEIATIVPAPLREVALLALGKVVEPVAAPAAEAEAAPAEAAPAA